MNRGRVYGKAGEKFRKTEEEIINAVFGRGVAHEKETMPEFLQKKLDDAFSEMITSMVQAPGLHEPQDTPMWLSAMLYGVGNPRLTHPVQIAMPFAPSTTFQNAINAYCKGYNPIYFIGYDLCAWKNKGYHRRYNYDGTKGAEAIPIVLNENDRVALNGFRTDYVQIGEKYALAGYFSNKYHGMYGFPGIQIVEVIVDGVAGNLEFFPRIDVERFAEGETRDVPQEKTASKIRGIIKARKTQKEWAGLNEL
jgi:hypothetical protein